MLIETKLDISFPTKQFLIKDFTAPYRLGRNVPGGGILAYNREGITLELSAIDLSNRGFSVEINLLNKKQVFRLSYNPQKSPITTNMVGNGKAIDLLSAKDKNFILIGGGNSTNNGKK